MKPLALLFLLAALAASANASTPSDAREVRGPTIIDHYPEPRPRQPAPAVWPRFFWISLVFQLR